MSIANDSADARGLGCDDTHACCEVCGADWAADDDCAPGCPVSCEVCAAPQPLPYGCAWLCQACAPDSTPLERMRQGES